MYKRSKFDYANNKRKNPIKKIPFLLIDIRLANLFDLVSYSFTNINKST